MVAEPARLDPLRLRRFAWRTRRGLLENDLVLARFLAARDGRISETEAAALDRLLDLTDPELLDLILGRTEPEDDLATDDIRSMVAALRAA